jgi:hypothetical protein
VEKGFSSRGSGVVSPNLICTGSGGKARTKAGEVGASEEVRHRGRARCRSAGSAQVKIASAHRLRSRLLVAAGPHRSAFLIRTD